MLSIIIPHFNSPGTLKILLDSIPKIAEIQIIVVDDKSTQGIEQYNVLTREKEYINVMFLENTTDKKGAGTCRNIGLERATGNWVLFADADDYFLSGFYEIVKRYFETDYDVIFFKPTSVDLKTGELSFRHLGYASLIDAYDKNDYFTELRLRYKWYPPWSKMI